MHAIFLAVAFPFLTPWDTPYDVQPWALAGAVLLLPALSLRLPRRLPWQLWVLIAVLVVAFLRALLGMQGDVELLGVVRSLAGYASLVVLGYTFWRFGHLLHPWAVAGVVLAWGLTWAAQAILGPDIVDPVLPRVSTTLARGLTSLAPEPADYARSMLLLMVLVEQGRLMGLLTPLSYALAMAGSAVQVILTLSGVGLLFLLVFVAVRAAAWFVEERLGVMQVLRMTALGAAVPLLVIATLRTPTLRDSRAGALAALAIKDPAYLLASDLSVSTRVFNPVLALYGGLVEARAVGFGLGSREDIGADVPEWLSRGLGVSRGWGGAVMGGFVEAVYELGLVGLLLLLAVLATALPSPARLRENGGSARLSSGVLFLGLTVPWGTLALPMVGACMGLMLAVAGGRRPVRPGPRVEETAP